MQSLTEALSRLYISQVVFTLSQAVLLGFFVYALYRVLKEARRRRRLPDTGGVSGDVVRGKESWKRLSLAFGVLSALYIVIVEFTEAYTEFKTLIIPIDFGILLYLSSWNDWSRNRLIGFVGKAQKRIEHH